MQLPEGNQDAPVAAVPLQRPTRQHPRQESSPSTRVLAVFNLGAWAWAVLAFHRFPVLLGTAFLAYSFGLRHAVDADHIAAIDNVTRKLMQEGKRPVAVGFMFSLGHSTIVVIGSIAIAATALALQHRIDHVRDIGSIVGTLVSTLFLFAIAIVNLIILRAVYRTFQSVRRGEPYVDEDFDLLLGSRGFLARLFRPVFRMIRSSWHMYPLGLLFGLGFDTATEIGLLGISAAEASKGLSLWSILVFPALFAAGMSPHRHHRQHPHARRLRLGLRQTHPQALLQPHHHLGLGPRRLRRRRHRSPRPARLTVPPRRLLLDRSSRKLNNNFGVLGYFIIGLFASSWILSLAIYKWRRFDHLD